MGALDLRDRAVEVTEDRRHDQAGAALGAVLAADSAAQRLYARAPASRCSGSVVATGLNPAPNGAPMVPVAASGPGNIDLAGDAVVVELLVALGGVPRAAHADLVEAVAVLVLAEPLLLELLRRP